MAGTRPRKRTHSDSCLRLLRKLKFTFDNSISLIPSPWLTTTDVSSQYHGQESSEAGSAVSATEEPGPPTSDPSAGGSGQDTIAMSERGTPEKINIARVKNNGGRLLDQAVYNYGAWPHHQPHHSPVPFPCYLIFSLSSLYPPSYNPP